MDSDGSFEDTDLSESGEELETNTIKEVRSSIKRKKEAISENGSPSKKKKKSELYKPPTVEELNRLKETENLFKNNLFRLQIQELLNEVVIKKKRKTQFSSWMFSFEKFIETLPEYDVSLSDLKKPRKKGTSSEFLQKLSEYEVICETDQDVLLKLIKPELLEKFGLYENNSLPGPHLLVDVNLIMPACCFVTKDFLNNRYLTKRYYYLLYIAEHLKKSELAKTLDIKNLGENLLPIIELSPNGCDKTIVSIYVSPADGTFKPARFLPEQNNFKLDLFNLNINSEVLKNSPTIYYNSALAHDATIHANIKFVRDTLKDQSNLQDGIKLLCIWLKQNELNVGRGAFTEKLIVYIIVYLFTKRKINEFMSSYQVARNFWNFVATTDLQNEPISVANATQETLNTFKKYFSVVVLDCTGCYNVASFLNLEVYKKVKEDCQSALRLLNDNKVDSFQQLFLTKYPFYLQYDIILDLTKSLPLEIKLNENEQDKAMHIGYQELLIFDNVLKLIRRALNERVSLTVPRIEMDNCTLKKFFIGVNLNPDKAYHYLELGPALTDYKAADDFRKFWGHLSSDRRFRDGSTNVAVHFKTNTIKGKRQIVRKILNYILGEKFEMKFNLYYDELEDILLSKRLVPSYPSGSNEETCFKVIHASDGLGKKLRSLDMPLKITGFQGLTDVFSYTDVFPPIPSNYKVKPSLTTIHGNNLIFANEIMERLPRFVKPIESVLKLEHSSKWPNELDALRLIKTSFCLEMSKILHKKYAIISHVTTDFIDILYEGLVFRCYLYVPKEVGLMKKVAAENGLTCFRESTESFEMEKTLNIMPKVVGALSGIQSSHPSYGPGTALVKRFLRAQLIDSYHISDIVINLLNASLYLNSNPPNTPQISFLRCLKFLSEFDWNLHPVRVNLNDELSSEEISELESKFQSNRESYPPLYIITPYDQGTSIFTRSSPSKEILLRIKQLSLESMNIMSKVTIDQETVDIKKMFIPNFDGYNVLIHLKPLLNPRRHEKLVIGNVEDRTVVEKYKASEEDKIPIVNFNPVEIYLRILRENYGRYALFFHDSFGGNTVGVLWHPKVFESGDFKVSRANAGKIVDEKICFNMDAVIEDFYILGKDLVETIEKR